MRRHPRYGTIVGRCLDGANQDASGGLGGLGGGNDDPYEEKKRRDDGRDEEIIAGGTGVWRERSEC